MKLNIKQLRFLIEKAFSNGQVNPPPDRRALQVVKHVVDVASDYVDSLVAGSPDQDSEREFKQAVEQCDSISQWMRSKHVPRSAEMEAFLRQASAMANSSGFWKRPAFLGRDDYIQKMQTMLRRLNTSSLGILSN